ncbi:MAG: hypothetical protein AMXMBFR84_18390 [Candidatus Hydrogenedentota bacterium]
MKLSADKTKSALALTATFCATRIVAYGCGFRFDDSALGVFMQYLDPQLLRDRLWESLWYLHIQPPLFNAYIGVVLKLAGVHAAILFHAANLIAGFAVYVSVYRLQRRLGVNPGLAYGVSSLFAVSPSFLLYEHMLLYELPCAACVVISAVCLNAASRNRTRGAYAGFFACLFLLGGIRTVFHIVYVAIVSAWVIIVSRHRRRAAVCATVALLALSSFYVKNRFEFGQFTVCTWTGKHLWIKTAGNLPWAEREHLVAEGVLSPVSLRNRFTAVSNYPPEYRHPGPYASVPCLSEEAKSSGQLNYNQFAQIAISQAYGRDAWAAFAYRPSAYVLTCTQAFVNYFKSPSHYGYESPNVAVLKPWLDAWDRILYWKCIVPESGRALLGRTVYPGLFGGLVLLVVIGATIAIKAEPADRQLLAYMLFTIAYVAFMGIALEILEVHRFRFMTEPFYTVIAGLAMQRLTNLLRKKQVRLVRC